MLVVRDARIRCVGANRFGAAHLVRGHQVVRVLRVRAWVCEDGLRPRPEVLAKSLSVLHKVSAALQGFLLALRRVAPPHRSWRVMLVCRALAV